MKEKNITFKMAERAIIEQKWENSKSFKREAVENVLK